MKYSLLTFNLLFSLILNSAIYSQSVGGSVGTSYISTYLHYSFLGSYKYTEIPLKNLFVEYKQDVLNNFEVSIAIGYGWNNFNSHEQYGDPGSQFSYSSIFELKSKGTPIELGLKYHKYLNADSTFEPMIGIGIGYCDYNFDLKQGYSYIFKSSYKLKGFSQYLSIGMKFHMTKRIESYFEVKKMLFNNIKITGDLNAIRQVDNSSFTQDYAPSSGLFDVGLDIGISYKL